MRKTKGKTVLFLMLTLISFFCCYKISTLTVEVSSDVLAESSLPENIVSKALKIINMAGEEGLTESDLKQLASLGLTDSQIEMLKNHRHAVAHLPKLFIAAGRQIHTVDQHGSFRGLFQKIQAPHQRALSCSRHADDAVDIPFSDIQADLL